jgi:crotonobetainyl-CoA:carnitine CoA-transferase CaiB-like acyl-CoA transferase
MTAEASAASFLKPYRVLDLTDERGLLAGHLLAQLGADVIQVEPPAGSPARRVGPFDRGQSLFWSAYAAGKRGVSLDLETLEGRDALLNLARGADVLIESAGPGAMDSLGLGYDAFHAANPCLVYVSITPFGAAGPKAAYAASDLIVWAAAGPMAPHRSDAGVPLKVSAPQAFLHAASDAACGALMALLAREATGRGQRVDISAHASCTLCTLFMHLGAAVGHPDYTYASLNTVTAPGSKEPLDLSGSGARTRQTKWRARDGLLEMHVGLGAAAGRFSNAVFGWLEELGERPAAFWWDWVKVPELVEAGELALADIDRARAHVEQVLSRLTVQEIVEAAQAKGFMAAPIMTTADLLASPQFKARGLFMSVKEAGRPRTLPAPFATGCGADPSHLRAAPAIGEHNAEVLKNPARVVATTDEAPARPPLEGLKVLDLAWVVAGPLVGRALADFGATVVRVESTQRLDTARVLGPFPGGKTDPQASVAFEGCNAGKLGLTLDLRREGARAVALDLAAWADVVIESFVPGQMEKFGLDYPRLKAVNPRLIMLSSSLMGQTGPMAQQTGFGNIGAAFSGLQRIVGERDELPIGPFGPYTDYVAPRFALLALLAALDRQRRTGEGCYLDISQAEATVSMIAPLILDYEANGRIAEAKGNRDDDIAPNGVFRTRGEDRWVAITARNDDEWRRLAGLVGGSALAGDHRFEYLDARKRHEDALEAVISAWTRDRDAGEVEATLQALGVPAHVVADSRDILADPQLQALGAIVKLAHPRTGETVIDAARFALSQTPARYERAAPTFGRDNGYVLGEILRYPPEKIEALSAAGALR